MFRPSSSRTTWPALPVSPVLSALGLLALVLGAGILIGARYAAHVLGGGIVFVSLFLLPALGILAFTAHRSYVAVTRRFERSKTLMRSILDSIPSGVLTTDSHATLTSFNRAAERLLLLPSSAAVGSAVDTLAAAAPELVAWIHSRLAGEGATIDLTGLSMLSGEQLSDVHSVVEHAVPRCETVESYKAILDGHARGVFAGRIRVLSGAQKTQAYQQISSLLLSEDAVIDTMPQLEIFADDVKCGHGGAVGQLDANALFYLRTRGLDEAAARGLLIYAFASEMVDRIGSAGLRDQARALVAARLPGGARLLEAA